MARAAYGRGTWVVDVAAANRIFRIAIVGASSLAGKELSDALSESVFAASSFTLLDEEQATGQIASAGDEISFIQKIGAASFDGVDLVFFAGDAGVTQRYWKSARKAGAAIIDLTAAFEGEGGVLTRAPWMAGAGELNLETSVVVSAHPAAVMLAFVAAKLAAKFGAAEIAATVLEPASQYGRAAMDELHQQTVSLLSFQTIPREQYDAQVAFNLLAALGEEAKIRLADAEARIANHYAALTGNAPTLSLQLLHAPVFHGYVASVFFSVGRDAMVEEVELALVGDHIDLVAKGSEPPSNLTAAGQEEIMIWVDSASPDGRASTRFKLLLAADNLRLAAVNAIACARELAQLRPLGKVQ
jgi:aspartate-semialdehyde dehydrogenase